MKRRVGEFVEFVLPFMAVMSVFFLCVRLYEFLIVFQAPGLVNSTLAILYDIHYSLAVAVVVTALALPVSLISVSAARIMCIIIGTCVFIVALALSKYYSVTLVPLGADFFAYTFSDIRTTVFASGGADLLSTLIFIFFIGTFVTICALVVRVRLRFNLKPRHTVIIILLLACVAFIPIGPDRASAETENQYTALVSKSRYFFDRAFTLLSASRGQEELTFDKDAYPFLHTLDYNRDVLGKYFAKTDKLPNVVFILVEGLGRDFTGPGAEYGGFTPFLDSLGDRSLYWVNGVSNAGRTFGVLPSILGSLPGGNNGFLSKGNQMPQHQTLISLLRSHGYFTSFFYGGNPNFDNQDIFLQNQGTDLMVNESNFSPSYKKMSADADGFTWGFADRQVFDYSLELLSSTQQSPRLDIYLTLSTHEPFRCPEKRFLDIVDRQVSQLSGEEARDMVQLNKNVFACLLYSDDAIRSYFKKYKLRPDFAHTIFIITGDHRLIPIPQKSRISRYHVPIMIYSPLLKSGMKFHAPAAHSDVPPTLLSYLTSGFGITFPSELPFISRGMVDGNEFEGTLGIPLSRNKGEVNDFIEGRYFLSEGRLFSLGDDMSLELEDDDAVQDELALKLETFNSKARFALDNNRVDKVTTGGSRPDFAFTADEQDFLRSEKLETKLPDEIFQRARQLATLKKYTESRLLTMYLLNQAPNYHDARLLLGRTFAWNAQYDTAQHFFSDVLKRAPLYQDAFVALADLWFWKGDHDKSVKYIDEGLSVHPGDPDLVARKARMHLMAGKKAEARRLASAVLEKIPDHEIATDVLAKTRQ